MKVFGLEKGLVEQISPSYIEIKGHFIIRLIWIGFWFGFISIAYPEAFVPKVWAHCDRVRFEQRKKEILSFQNEQQISHGPKSLTKSPALKDNLYFLSKGQLKVWENCWETVSGAFLSIQL